MIGEMRFTESIPAFPLTVSVESTSIILAADGTYEGDRDAFLDAVQNLKQGYHLDGNAIPLLWLIARAITEDKRK